MIPIVCGLTICYNGMQFGMSSDFSQISFMPTIGCMKMFDVSELVYDICVQISAQVIAAREHHIILLFFLLHRLNNHIFSFLIKKSYAPKLSFSSNTDTLYGA